MKIKLTILFVFVATILFAQKKFTATLTGGTNYMFIPDSVNPGNTISGKFAYQAGFELSYRIFKNFKIGISGIYSTMTSEEVIKKVPEDEIFNYDIYLKKTLKFTEFPIMYLSYDFLRDKKIIPYIKLGGSFININELSEKVLKTDPAGHETDFRAQFYNFTFKNDMLYITDMNAVFAGIGADYKLYDSFSVGLGINAKRFFYYEFDNKRSNYTLSGNLRISYIF